MSYNIIRNQKNQGKSLYIIILILLFFCGGLLVNLFKLTDLWLKTKGELTRQQTETTKLNEENQELKFQIKKRQTDKYFEEKARQLSLSKKDELILIPPAVSPSPYPSTTPKIPFNSPSLWLALFLKTL
jgi:cell division protein FtsB